MAQLNDSMASQIMGEIDVVTRRIDDLQGRIELQLKNQGIISHQMDDAKKQFVATLNNLITEAEALKVTQVKSIQDQLALSMTQIDTKSNSMVGVIEKAAKLISQRELDNITVNTATASSLAVDGVLGVIERKFGEALRAVAGANKSFDEVKGQFIKDTGECIVTAQRAIAQYDRALQTSAAEHRPIGAWGFFFLTILAAVIGSVISFGALKTTAGDSPKQAELAARGAKFDEIYQQLDAKTQEKINKLWK